MVFKGKKGSKTEFHRNGLLATLGSNLMEEDWNDRDKWKKKTI